MLSASRNRVSLRRMYGLFNSSGVLIRTYPSEYEAQHARQVKNNWAMRSITNDQNERREGRILLEHYVAPVKIYE